MPTEFFPPSDNGWISATVKLEQNLSVDYTARIARQIDSIIYKNYPEVTLVSASSGANSSDDAFAAMQTTGSHIINYNLRQARAVDLRYLRPAAQGTGSHPRGAGIFGDARRR